MVPGHLASDFIEELRRSNMIERFFAELTERKIKRGAHRSVQDLKRDIKDYIENRNQDPKPFKWVRTADQILQAVKRYYERIAPDKAYEANS